MTGQTNRALSVVVTTISDTLRPANADQLRLCLKSLAQQVAPPSMEIIVPHTPLSTAVTELKREFPEVRFLEITDLKRWTGRYGSREHHNELRARGISAACGDIIALTDDCGEVDPRWCEQIVEAHQASVAGVAGAVELGAAGLLNAALYFCEFGRYQQPLAEGDTPFASDANVSYKRPALESIRRVWSDRFEEMTANPALRACGERIVLSSRIVVYENRLHLDLRTAIAERFIFGRSYGAGRGLTGVKRLIWAALCPFLPCLILTRFAAMAISKKRNLGIFCRAFPILGTLTIAWCLGEMTSYLSAARREPDSLRPELPDSSSRDFRLSVVVAMVAREDSPAGARGLAGVLDGLRGQSVSPFEIIVPLSDAVVRAQFQARYPEVNFLPALPDSPPGSSERVQELRAIGVAAAQGDLVAVTEDHVRPDPEWVEEILKAHCQGYAAIGGAIENGLDNVLNWATYFADLGRYHNPLPAGPAGYASVVNVSYKRASLERLRGVWLPRFHETAVHSALMACGEKLAFAPGVVVRQYRPEVRLGPSLREFYLWGRSYGGLRARTAGPGKRFLYACATPLIPGILLCRSGLDVARKKRLLVAWLKALPIGTVLTAAWACGELAGYLGGEAHRSEAVRQERSCVDSSR